jgi:hypothetical protein
MASLKVAVRLPPKGTLVEALAGEVKVTVGEVVSVATSAVV